MPSGSLRLARRFHNDGLARHVTYLIARPDRDRVRTTRDWHPGNPGVSSGRIATGAAVRSPRDLGYGRVVTCSATDRYEDLIGVSPALITFSNEGEGESYGAEVAVTWRVSANWRLEGSYSFVQVQLHGEILQTPGEQSTPHNMAQLRSYYNVTQDLEFNAALYYVDEAPARLAESYLRLDLGVTYRPTDHLELAVWGRNLLDASHREFSGRDEVERSAYFMATLRF